MKASRPWGCLVASWNTEERVDTAWIGGCWCSAWLPRRLTEEEGKAAVARKRGTAQGCGVWVCVEAAWDVRHGGG